MAKPTAVTEFGTAKVMLLADSAAGTPGAYAPVAVIGGTSGEPTYPVAWSGIATHRRGDAIGTPGGFTPSAAPVVVVAGFDASVAGTVRAIATDENGLVLTSQRGALNLPLQQPTAGVQVSAASEVGIALADSTRYQYLQRLHLMCVGTVLGGSSHQAGSWSLKNGSAGTVLNIFPYKLTPAVGDQLVFEFPTPHKTNVPGGSFVIIPSSTFLGTWQVIANGFRSVL